MAILKQTALSITKENNVLTLTWKLADFYDSQETYWSIDGQKILTTLAGDDTSVQYEIPVENYFPATTKKLPSVTIGVRGIVNGKPGPWATATYKFLVPNKPVVTKEALKFIWETDTAYVVGKGDPNLIDVEYQRVDSTSATQSQVKWGADASSSDFIDVTGENSSGEVSYTETEKVEWFRCCARGLNGQSAWVYAYHVNAMPYTPTGLVAKAAGKNITLTWKNTSTAEHPLDYQCVQYCYATPTEEDSKGVPVCPDGVIWTTGQDHIVPTARKTVFTITQFPPVDQCLFVRVCSVCESNTAVSDPIFAMAGYLVAPTLSSISLNPTTKTTVVTYVENSSVALAKIAVINSSGKVLGTAAHGETTITVKGLPNSENMFGIKAWTGKSASKPCMKSDNVFITAGNVPLAPTNVAANATERDGVAEISWEIPWSDAQSVEVSWSDHEDAWESTDGPQTYEINQRATWWNIAGLISGVVYYFRVRLRDTAKVFSPYSQMVSLSFASAPGKPTLTSSAVTVQPGEAIQLSWTYETTDTTEQDLAVIYDNGEELARVENNAQRISITPAWLFGSSHSLTVQTTSQSGYLSAMSDPVVITVAARPEISPIDSAISSGITDGVLTDLPIVMEVTGAGEGGQTTIKIERLKDYFVERPDESVTEGYDGETIFAVAYGGDGELTIGADDLVGSFDDGGDYRLTAIVQDSVGQKASSYLDFTVKWTHQAETPTAAVDIDPDTLTARIRAFAPASYESGDTVDIYRLSADKPELIVKGGNFGTYYIDPYPASNGGYRFVDITANGDYTNETGIAWIDIDHDLVLKEAIIDFGGGERLALPYNLELQSSWEKDFEETKYLNGHVVGDWNKAVSRTVSLNTLLLRNDERIATIRDLAVWSGICHVRTPDGSSYSANVQVSESASYSTKAVSFTFSITRVDPEGYEGIDEASL
ncbi:MAG: hypothetical protein J6Y57_01150 [Lachnospiraceae bacterium]|nr:hypothetical protein [Lachnospiraceae bacterium]